MKRSEAKRAAMLANALDLFNTLRDALADGEAVKISVISGIDPAAGGTDQRRIIPARG